MLKPIGKHIYYLDHQPETDRPFASSCCWREALSND